MSQNDCKDFSEHRETNSGVICVSSFHFSMLYASRSVNYSEKLEKVSTEKVNFKN